MRSVTEADIKDKRVIVRVDWNVIFNKGGEIEDDFRIRQTLPTIKFLQERGARSIILLSHLGRPSAEDKGNSEFSLRPLATYLSNLLGIKVYFFTEDISSHLSKKIKQLDRGSIVLLENIRFYPGELRNDDVFAKELALLGDIYVNEAFSVSHRKQASLCAITKYLSSYGGLLLEKEVQRLRQFLHNLCPPVVIIMGGAKTKDKLPLIKKFLLQADYILGGGILANTILKSWGFEIGNSLWDKEVLEEAKSLGSRRAELVLPGDFLVLTKTGKVQKRGLGEIKKTDTILDIGPIAADSFVKIINKARTIFWNGPMGKFEDERFSQGTQKISKAILKNNKAYSVIGGGETLASIKDKDKFLGQDNIFLSTGGGATLKFLAGEKLPALECLK